ncbi:S1-like domain-containing RNA-binding protein [Oceanobacillus oncorhynchi subsp. oncorhynchi]|uniref:CvfB family protein n=1 Tax=Oceanobacillus oncorhynchi TaxID=545501 RepID=UPI0031E0608B
MPTDLPIGSIIAMTVLRKIDTGYVLSAYGEEVLLHHNEAQSVLELDQSVDVFLYVNKKEQVNATTYLPSVTLGLYDWAEVVGVLPRLGVFVNIGTSKDILVSKDSLPLFQESWPRSGDRLYITLQLDKKGRLLGVPASENIIANNVFAAPEQLNQQTVIGTVYYTNKEGAAIITSEGYRGFIHRTERKMEPRVGQVVEGRVIAVKEDGSINVSLRPLKQDSLSDDADAILKHLEANNGAIPFHDKSNPEEIRATFQISKSAFKRAVGTLLKRGQIKQENEQIIKVE